MRDTTPICPLRFWAIAVTMACSMIGASSAAAETRDLRFDVLFGGMAVAEATVTARMDGASYALAGRVHSTGLAAVFARVRFQMQAEGYIRNNRPAPQRYSEDVDTGHRASTVELRFNGGAATVTTQAPPPGAEAVPADQAAGHVDPLSALWHLVQGDGGAMPCDWSLPVYDGVRQSMLRLGPASQAGETVECAGHYIRVAGFPPEVMAERTRFAMTATYRATGAGWELTEVAAMSLFGPIRIVRRD